MFSRNEISCYDDDTSTVYTCPHCHESVKFHIRDFDRHWSNRTTNLSTKDFKGAPKGRGFLDFYCPKCSTPTTVAFDQSAGGRHGEYWYTIKRIDNDKAL